jgi:4-amino-4-deoxy-L-arabinose transferase-like glycosyltransferase
MLILLAGFALRVAYITVDRFHADEALYAGWALSVLDDDPLLLGAPVDKPPLSLYALAGSFAVFGRSELAARVPGLWASLLGICLTYCLGTRLYDGTTGTLAALFLALSPYDILFARTAFTDPALVVWTLAALYAAASRRWLASGLSVGLAFAAKQHALVLTPLVLATGLIVFLGRKRRKGLGSRRYVGRAAGAFASGLAAPLVGVLAWDSARWPTRPGFWQQSKMSYGGLAWAPVAEWGARLVDWLGWARYLPGSIGLASMVCLLSLALLLYGWLWQPQRRATWLDTLWIAYIVAYLLLHTVLEFAVWDRYLLPLAPLVSLILARSVSRVGGWRSSTIPMHWTTGLPHWFGACVDRTRVLVPTLILCLALASGLQAARNGYPVGGEHWAYHGLDEIALYLRENAPDDAVLYHHWLRWHYGYYLYGTSFEQRWWESAEHMEREVLRTPDRVQYVVLPEWRTISPETPELSFELLYQARRPDDSVSLRLYRVYPRVSGHVSSRAI